MKNEDKKNLSGKKVSRRKFLGVMGAGAAGLILAPYLKSENVYNYRHSQNQTFLAKVAITEANTYDRTLIKNKVQYLFDSIDGIQDIVKSGKKVGIKINLTGGSGSSSSPLLAGTSIQETMWTHPEVLRATGELIIDSGVSPSNIYIVESLWDFASFNNFGYSDVQKSLGVQMIDLNKKDPYSDFYDKPVGDKKIYFNSFKINQILNDIDVYVSIPKMKHHYEAGVTNSIKNQIGMVPIQFYTLPSNTGMRSMLHFHTESGIIGTTLPQSICDLNLARPVYLAIIDGIKNATGGEGVWNPTFKKAESHVLLAGKDPVATDSIATYLMGLNPEGDKFPLPDGVRQCDNYLKLLAQRGMGTNKMNEINVVGDGAYRVTAVRPEQEIDLPEGIQLCQNFPNPFNSSTVINFYLPNDEFVKLKIYNSAGEEIETLVNGTTPKGNHEIRWTPKNISSGVYIYQIQAGKFSDYRKLIYQK